MWSHDSSAAIPASWYGPTSHNPWTASEVPSDERVTCSASIGVGVIVRAAVTGDRLGALAHDLPAVADAQSGLQRSIVLWAVGRGLSVRCLSVAVPNGAHDALGVAALVDAQQIALRVGDPHTETGVPELDVTWSIAGGYWLVGVNEPFERTRD